MMARIARRVMNRCVSSAFTAWADAAVELRRTRVLLTRVASKIAHRSLSQAFGSWCDVTGEQRARIRDALASHMQHW